MADTIDVTNPGTEISSKGRKKSSGGKFDKKKKTFIFNTSFQ